MAKTATTKPQLPLGKMRIEERKVADLKPAPYNPRTISSEALAGLDKSITEFGVVEPIILNERTGHVVGGHRRLQILEKRKVPVTDVVIIDVDELKEKALNVALNSPHISGEFDMEALEVLLEEIKVEGGMAMFEELRFDEFDFKVNGKDGEDVADRSALNFATRFEVIVTCDNENQQRELFEELSGRGLKTKALQL